jgi:hypothetical protein
VKIYCPRCRNEVIVSPEMGTMCDGCGLVMGFRVDYDSPREVLPYVPAVFEMAGTGI